VAKGQQNILVTGGAGYIGSHAVRRLIEKGYKVTVVDNLCHGHQAAVDKRANFYQIDIRETGALVQIMRENAIDAVMHFAAYIEVGESQENPLKYYDNNLVGGISLLKAVHEAGVGKFVFSSTAAVYGNPSYTPIDESHPRLPINTYGHTKNMMETVLMDCCRSYNLSCIVFRYFNVAGASPDGTLGEDHEPESHLIPRVLAAAEAGTEVSVYGNDYPTPDGSCVRDYIHVVDLVDAHILALECLQPGAPRIFNLGSESGYSVFEVLDTCRKVLNKEIRVMVQPRRAGDPPVLIAKNEKARELLQWKPQFGSLIDILSHAWQWHKTHPQGYRSSKDLK
jgi:UDP-glucose 4-epimerase